MALRGWLSERFFTADPRALGAGRIALASVLLLDLARRARDLETWYTNDGLLPNHTTLWKPPFEYTFSLFFTASRTSEATVGFVLCGFAYVLLLVGLRTKLAQVASLLAVLSLHGRCEFVQNGGDAVLGELALWTCFLPMGRRYSFDAVRRARALGPRWEEEAKKPVVGLAVLMLLLQLAVIYGFNALQKSGETWRAGWVVHYMLYQASNDTWFAVWVRDHLTLYETRLLTWAAWGTEGILPFVILSPWAQRWTRRLAVLLIVALHGGFATFLNLGIFVPAMIAFTPNLLGRADYDLLERWVGRSGVAARFARAPATVRAAFDGLVARAAAPRLDAAEPPFLERSEVWDGILGVVIICVASELLVENPKVTHFKPEWQPQWMRAAALYLQAFQGWAMYAPDPPFSDVNLHVDAVTRDGRHVDPFNELASPGAPDPGKEIPPHLAQDVLYFAYVLRLPWTPDYYSALEDWILLYPHRTRHPADAIASFEVFVVERDSPRPGEHQVGNAHTRLLFKYPHH